MSKKAQSRKKCMTWRLRSFLELCGCVFQKNLHTAKISKPQVFWTESFYADGWRGKKGVNVHERNFGLRTRGTSSLVQVRAEN